MTTQLFNLLAQLPAATEHEDFYTLFDSPSVRVERIVSDGQSSPAGFWYDQPYDEWILLLQGEAVLESPKGQQHILHAGDSLCVVAHCRHRVVSTASRTVWLAVHVLGDAQAA